MTLSPTNPLLLIDGSSFFHRAYHAVPPSKTAFGQPTAAVKGVVSMVRRLCIDHADSNIIFVLDAEGQTFRHAWYPEYKATRPPKPEDLLAQEKPMRAMIEAMGIPVLSVQGVEADDSIGTLATDAVAGGQCVVIATSDKDMAQLVNDSITLLNTQQNSRLDRAGVMAKFGVPPEMIVDYLALLGDADDNIPGVTGLGVKSVVAILQGIGNLATVYQDLSALAKLSVRGARLLPDKLREGHESARLSYKLARIRRDVPLPVPLSLLCRTRPNIPALSHLCRELEFVHWCDQITAGRFL